MARNLHAFSHLCSIQLDFISFGKCEIINITDDILLELERGIFYITENSSDSDEIKTLCKSTTTDLLNRHIKSRVCIRMQILAEPDRAREIAIDEARKVLDLLWFVMPIFCLKGYRAEVGLQGDIIRSSRLLPLLSENQDVYNLTTSRIGPLSNFVISEEVLAGMEARKIVTVSKILSKNIKSRNDFELAILQGIHWFADGQIQKTYENRFLSLTTYLETFLNPRDKDYPIVNYVAEAVAILLFQGVELRKSIMKDVKRLYGYRSAITHGGNKAILESEIDELTQIAGSLILTMIQRVDDFKSQKELLDWIQIQKLS